MNELIGRALYYGHNSRFDLGEPFMRGIVLSARATLNALQKADVLTEDEIKSRSQDFGHEEFYSNVSF